MSFNQFPEWWIFVGAIGLLMLLVHWDVKARSTRLRWARLVAIIVVIIALLGLYAEPAMVIKKQQLRVALITENAEQSMLDSLKQTGYQLTEWNQSIDLAELQNAIELLIVGDGLEQWELNQLKRIDGFIPSKNREEGVIDISVANAVQQSPLAISMKLNINEVITIAISGSGIETKIKEVTPDKPMLTMEVLPNLSGYLTYQLAGIREKDTLFSETISVQVADKKKTNVLMLSNTPSFEYRSLKNHLAEEGFGIAERLQVSTDLYHEAFTNIDQRRLTSLSNHLLESFQLLVLNTSSYQNLRRNEKQIIQSRIKKGELGLVLMGVNSGFDLTKFKEVDVSAIELQSSNRKMVLSGSENRIRTNSTDIQFQNKLIGQVSFYGLGQIVLPTFTDSHILKLQGEGKLYATLWQQLLNDAIGSESREDLIQTPDFPRVNEPTKIQLSGVDKEAEIVIQETKLGSEQTWFDLNSQTVTYFPKKRGWHQVNELEEQFFVFDFSDYPLQKRMQKQQQTAAYFTKPSTQILQNKLAQEPISKWIFFTMFLLGMSFLWIEQRVG